MSSASKSRKRGRIVIEKGDLMPFSQEIFCHRTPHGPDTDEANPHHRNPMVDPTLSGNFSFQTQIWRVGEERSLIGAARQKAAGEEPSISR